MVFQTFSRFPLLQFLSNGAYISGQSGGITTYLCLTLTHGLHDFSPDYPRCFIYFFIGSRELAYFNYFIEALTPSLIAFYRSYMLPAYSDIRSALSLRLVFIKWIFIHLMRHRGFRLAGYPYRTDFDPCQGVIISELCLWKFPGVFTDTQRLSSLWTLTITYPDFVTTCDYITHLTPHGFELEPLEFEVPK